MAQPPEAPLTLGLLGHAVLDLRQTVSALRTGLIEEEDGVFQILFTGRHTHRTSLTLGELLDQHYLREVVKP